MKRYTIDDRLSDVIALISLLAVGKSSFKKISGLSNALRGEPRSAGKWEDIASDHSEFFRFNGKKDNIALLMRSYFETDEDGHRESLSVEETQKLIDTAI